MGMICPKCGTHQAIVRNVTATGEGATKADQVIFRILACGHQVGGSGFRDFQEKANKIDVETAEAIARLREKAADAKANLYVAMTKKEGAK